MIHNISVSCNVQCISTIQITYLPCCNHDVNETRYSIDSMEKNIENSHPGSLNRQN